MRMYWEEKRKRLAGCENCPGPRAEGASLATSPAAIPANPVAIPAAIPATSPAIPATSPAIPVTSPAIPAMSPAIPATSPAIPATIPAIPVANPATTSATTRPSAAFLCDAGAASATEPPMLTAVTGLDGKVYLIEQSLLQEQK